jgi:5-methylcytosine-specific restriction endonuclease McrA
MRRIEKYLGGVFNLGQRFLFILKSHSVHDAGISNARMGNDCTIAARRPDFMTSANSVNSLYQVYKCTSCGETKPTTRENFSTRGGKPRLPCRACKRKIDKEYQANNRERARERAKHRKALNENIGYVNEHHQYRERLLNDQHGKCYFGGEHITIDTIEIDHLIPVSKGGTNEYKNLVGCCYFCNREKHNKTEDEYRLWRETTYKNFK